MSFAGTIEPYDGPLPAIRYRWDPETEILSGALDAQPDGSGYTGTIELEGPDGAFITLDVQGGTLAAIEIVVWPEVATRDDLAPPDESRPGRLNVPPRPSQPGIALVEVDVTLAAARNPDGSVVHLTVGPARRSTPFRLADNLIIEMDHAGQPAGFWLLDVPPFPTTAGSR